ncbi:MAG: helical backbone metal receptor [Bacteroidota bacterium]
MNTFTDQIGMKIVLKDKPVRIVSVVPSQTELLFDLGLDEEVLGITKFCIHPDKWFRSKVRVGGTKNLDLEKIRELKPDIIFANKEENKQDEITELQKHFPVWTSDIKDLNGALEMIDQIGLICDKVNEAKLIVHSIEENFRSLQKYDPLDCIYLIWNKPIMTIGGDTFINDMLVRSGFGNLSKNLNRYPALSESELIHLNPACLLLSSEPFPFKEEHVKFYRKLLPSSRIIIVDGEMFSWYGSRLMKAPGYFSELRLKIENAL